MDQPVFWFFISGLCFGFYIAVAKNRSAIKHERHGPTGQGWPKEYIVQRIKDRIIDKSRVDDDCSAKTRLSLIRSEAEHIVDGAYRGSRTYYD
tara:strand:- start:27097 stop:27375 length:279 start_codon:yes stop_codon:yes gene_type:complete